MDEMKQLDQQKDEEKEKNVDGKEKIQDEGQITLENSSKKHRIHLLSIIGEIEGHEEASSTTKTTKYEHVLPRLAMVEDDKNVDGLLVLLNTVGGDVESGLAIAEMIATMKKPSVSLVLGGSHSIGIPLAVSTDYSFIVPSGTMVVHPVRINGLVIGAPQSFDYFKQMQDRISRFITSHSFITEERFLELMMETGKMTKDLGTILVGQQAVEEGIINEVGGISDALNRLHVMIDEETCQ
ncbi:MAG: ClpP family protease [Lachnospiraceae bacterium]